MKPYTLRPWMSVLAAGLLATLSAQAQFKVVGPDGKVTYTDRAPPAADAKSTAPVARSGGGGGSDLSALPFTLRQVVSRFPVTLYTSSKCEPCDQGRALLQRRGIPFSERTATTPEDRDQWEKTLGGPEAPVLRIGQQVMRGFNPSQWDETLDLAGYPKTSQLPASFKTGVAEPLAERKAAPVAAAPAPAAPAIPPPVDTRSSPNNIRF